MDFLCDERTDLNCMNLHDIAKRISLICCTFCEEYPGQDYAEVSKIKALQKVCIIC